MQKQIIIHSILQDILKSFCFSLLIFAAFWLASYVLLKKLSGTVTKIQRQKKHLVIEKLLEGFKRPLAMYLKLAGLCFAFIYLFKSFQNQGLPPAILAAFLSFIPILNTFLRIITVMCVAWGLISSSEITSLVLDKAHGHLDLQMGRSVAHFLAAVFNVLVISIAVVIILSELNYDINGLVAGLGLGGLTVALAAKDSAANFFGGLVLIMEKPFEIGDWISCKDVEGTVEDINLRSTKIRTSAGSLTTVPNAVLSSAPITNWADAMDKRSIENIETAD